MKGQIYISPWVYTQVQCPCVSLCRKSWSQHYRNLPSRTLKEFFTYQLYVHFDIEPKGSGTFHSLSIGRKFELSHVIFFKALFATLWSIQDMIARLLLQKESGYCRIKTIYSIFLKIWCFLNYEFTEVWPVLTDNYAFVINKLYSCHIEG